MEYAEYCDLIRVRYPRRHPHLCELRDDFFVPGLVRAVRAGTPAALRGVLREVHPQVFVFDMLRPDFCRDLLDEAAHFERWCSEEGLPLLRPNTMNNYGAILDSF